MPDIGDVRRYWNARPCNVRHSTASVTSRQFHEEVTRRKYTVEPHIPRFADFNAWDGKRVLDAGCGIGTTAISFAQAGAEVTAIDLSGVSLEVARRRAASAGVVIEFVQGNLENLKAILPPQTFDLIFCFGVIHHTPQPRKAVEQLMQYMEGGSLLRAMVYHRRSLKVLGSWMRGERVREHSEAQPRCPIANVYSRSEARELFEGLDVSLSVEHIFPYKVKDYIRGELRKRWWCRALPRDWFRWLERRYGWHLLVEGRLP